MYIEHARITKCSAARGPSLAHPCSRQSPQAIASQTEGHQIVS